MRKGAGFALTIITILAALVGVVAYMMNCQTNYFLNLGIDVRVVGCLCAAVVVLLIYLIAARKGPGVMPGFLPVIATILLVAGTLFFAGVRINGIASIMTFEGNASTMQDLTSAIVGLAGCLVAIIFSVIASFFDVAVPKKTEA